MIPRGIFGKTANYCNKHDMVSNIGKSLCFEEDVTIIETGYSSGSLASPILDRLMASEGYDRTVEFLLKEILRKDSE